MAFSVLSKLKSQLTEKDLIWGAGGGAITYLLGAAFCKSKNTPLAVAILSLIAIPIFRYHQRAHAPLSLHRRHMQQEFPQNFYAIQPTIFKLTRSQREAREKLLHYMEMLPQEIARQINPQDAASLMDQLRRVEKWMKENPWAVRPSREETPTPKIEYFAEDCEGEVENNDEVRDFLCCCQGILPREVTEKIDPFNNATLRKQKETMAEWMKNNSDLPLFKITKLDLKNSKLTFFPFEFLAYFPQLEKVTVAASCEFVGKKIAVENRGISVEQEGMDPEDALS